MNVFGIIDRYIGKTFLYYFLVTLLVFVTLFLVVDFMVTTSKYGVGLTTYLKYYTYFGFEITYQLFPVACLMSTVFTLAGLNKNSELVALFSLGWSLFRVSAPILFLVILISGAGFFASNQFMTKITDRKNYTYYVEMRDKPWLYTTSKQERIWYRSGPNIFYINLLNAKEAKAFDVTVYTFSPDWRLQQILTATEATIQNGQWRLKNGSITVFLEDQSPPIKDLFQERVLVLGEDMIDIKTTSKASATMGVGELHRYIQRNKEAGLNTVPFEVDYYAKFGFAFTALVMVLLGIPFSVSSNRGGGMLANLQICILLTMIYWGFYSSGLTIGRHGALPPVIAAWGPNLIMAVFGGILIRRLKK